MIVFGLDVAKRAASASYAPKIFAGKTTVCSETGSFFVSELPFSMTSLVATVSVKEVRTIYGSPANTESIIISTGFHKLS